MEFFHIPFFHIPFSSVLTHRSSRPMCLLMIGHCAIYNKEYDDDHQVDKPLGFYWEFFIFIFWLGTHINISVER